MAVASLSTDVWILDTYGPVEPSTLLGPGRQGLGKFGDGLFVEEGATNLETNPNFELGLTGWTTTGSATQALSTLRSHSGTQSNRVTATAAGGGTQNSVTVVSGQAHSFSRYVYVESGSVNLVATVGATGTSATITSATPGWQRLTLTNITTTGTSVTLTVAAVGGAATFHVDDAQTEQKAYCTSYADGSLATLWNATGNLLPTAAQSFEDGTTASAISSGTATLSNSGAQFYAGTKSLLATVTSTAVLTVRTSAGGTGGALVTPGKTHSASTWIRPSAARQFRAEIVFYDASGASLATPVGSYSTAAANVFNRYSVSAVAPAGAVYAATQWTSSDATNGDLIYTDAQRIDDGTGSAAYRWTGAENASTSTRTAGQIAAPLPSTLVGPFTVCGWFRIGQPASAAVARYLLALPVASRTPNLYYQGTQIVLSSGVDATAVVAITPAAGDLLFAAMSIAADGKTYSLYASQNGAAVVSNTSAASAVAYGGASTIGIGDLVGGSANGQLDGVVEQVLVYNAALNSTEIAALAFATSETAYKDDTRIVLATATGVVRGTTKAATSAGTGFYRGARKISSSFEQITPTGANPDDDNATIKITVPAGSGIGQGQQLALDPVGSSGRYTVQRVFSPGGALDELLVA